MKQRSTADRLFLPLLILLGGVGVLFVLYATRWGAALSDDSYFYIKPARDILAGLAPGFSPHYPPGLPLLLVPIGWLGIDPQAGIRLLNAACFGVNIALGGWLVRGITRSSLIALGAALLLLLAQPLLEVHSWAMSEALFITLMLATVICLGAYLQKGKIGWLLAGALLAGLSGVTRYAGIATIAAGAAGLLLIPMTYGSPRGLLRHLADAIGFGLLSGLIYAIYPLTYPGASGQVSGASSFHLALPGIGSITDLFYNTILWVMPGRLARGHEVLVFLGLLAALAILVFLFAFLRKDPFRRLWKQVSIQPHILFLLLFAAASFLVLYQANQSAYRSPFDFRLLSPTHLALFLAIMSILGLLWKQGTRFSAVRILLVLGFVFAAGLYTQRTVDTLRLYHEKGMGFASQYWHDSDIVTYLRQLPAQTIVVTTAPMGIYFSSAHESLLFTAYTPDQLAAFLKEKNGVFVYIQSMPFDLYGQDEQAYLSRLRLVKNYSNSAVYQAP